MPVLMSKGRSTQNSLVSAHLWGYMENVEKALKHFQSAQAIAEEIGAQSPLAEALLGLGLVQERGGDTSAALKHYGRALAVAHPIQLRLVLQVATNRLEEN